MTRADLRQVIESLAGDRLTHREMKLILEAATAYAIGDAWDLQRARRRILLREAAAAEGRGYGRRLSGPSEDVCSGPEPCTVSRRDEEAAG